MLVFRVENKNGRGPYRCGNYHESLEKHNGCPNHPSGNCDGIDTSAFYNIRYGFPCRNSLTAWFFGHIKFLKPDFYIAVYEVSEENVRYGSSRKQLVFNYDEAKLVEKKKFGSKLRVLKKVKELV